MKLITVSAGLSTPSATRLLADRLTEAACAELAARPAGTTAYEAGAPAPGSDAAPGGGGTTRGVVRDVRAEVLELRELAGDIARHLVTGFPPPRLATAIDAVTRADGLIAVTPVFAASYSGLFKSFFDLIDPGALTGTPVLIAATGGTARHSLVLDHALRPLFAHLRTTVAPTGVYAASGDWGSGGDTYTDGLPARIRRAGGELAALVAARPPRSEHEDDDAALERQLADLRFD
ncbi:CE1759 family FMN reductase [Streptomyces sp. NPDC015131]|uniref:CE1759 family FMN reductase n=1 Tax=Streptomyces sp. NPDC015131 TaxID=3364941 RepID=UPI0036F838E8